MLPDTEAMISYKRVNDFGARMGNDTLTTVLDRGSTIISFNGKVILTRNVLHILALSYPIYSLRAYSNHNHCGHGSTCDSSMFVWFLSIFLQVDTSHNYNMFTSLSVSPFPSRPATMFTKGAGHSFIQLFVQP